MQNFNLKLFFKYLFLFFILTIEIYSKPYISAKAAVVLDVTSNQFIYLKNEHLKLPPASTLKLLTAMIVVDKFRMNKMVTVPSSVISIAPYKLHLRPGDKYKTLDLLYALLLRSANDVAHTLAVRISGSERKFARLMNKKAEIIGLKNSNFKNPHGLPDSHQYVTAKDMALLTNFVRKYPLLIEVLNKKTKQFKGPGNKKINLISRNKLLFQKFRPKVLGKTGYTRLAGRCFAGFTFGVKTPVVIILLKSKDRWGDLKILAKWADHFYRAKINRNKQLLNQHQIITCQKFLKNIGFLRGEIDGVFGTQTEAAILRLQHKRKLKIDGVVGSKTLNCILFD